jgi:hypothetical protein
MSIIFDDLVDRRCDLIKSVLMSKAEEYAQGANRFHNFDVAARVNAETPERALWGMATKHLICILDMVALSPKDLAMLSNDYLDEKIGDMINYLILLEGMIKLRRVSHNG